MDFNQYLKKVAQEKESHPEWRMGQTYFNVLHEIAPDFADSIRGMVALDPLYRDEVIGAFLYHVWCEWEDVFWSKRR